MLGVHELCQSSARWRCGGEWRGGTRLKIDTCSPATGGLQRSRSDVKRMRE